jgi:hypothetical protein
VIGCRSRWPRARAPRGFAGPRQRPSTPRTVSGGCPSRVVSAGIPRPYAGLGSYQSGGAAASDLRRTFHHFVGPTAAGAQERDESASGVPIRWSAAAAFTHAAALDGSSAGGWFSSARGRVRPRDWTRSSCAYPEIPDRSRGRPLHRPPQGLAPREGLRYDALAQISEQHDTAPQTTSPRGGIVFGVRVTGLGIRRSSRGLPRDRP